VRPEADTIPCAGGSCGASDLDVCCEPEVASRL
jgi:hypothetical protein